eukprot:768536-Hanusia_phi.AAC.14
MKRSSLLFYCIFAYLKTLMDSSSEFNQLGFAPGVTIEGQYLASLVPTRSFSSKCANFVHRNDIHSVKFDGSLEHVYWQRDQGFNGQFWRVLLHDDDQHTMEYAMDVIEDILKQEHVGPFPGFVRKARVRWIAYQTHHYGKGTVATLPEGNARRVQESLASAGFACSLVPE